MMLQTSYDLHSWEIIINHTEKKYPSKSSHTNWKMYKNTQYKPFENTTKPSSMLHYG